MAVLDVDRNVVVVRIVYDGPPKSGKTTSVNALAARLGREVYCPEQRNGRTTYFDWMDYTGGRFEGHQIRCQILSVPGQLALASRRQLILRDADAIVFVADTSASGLNESLARLRELPEFIDSLASPPVGVIVQANKQDIAAEGAMDKVRRCIARTGLAAAVTESVAQDGSGVRESFVFAVRLALDRVRELSERGMLATRPPGVDNGAQMFESMQITRGPDDNEQVVDELLADEARAAERPAPPDLAVASGAIWPPVKGRLILHEATGAGLRTHSQLEDGSWVAGLGGAWRVCSAGHAQFNSFETGRAALIAWARLHAACTAYLSGHRCIVLSEASAGRWRLWQIVRVVEPLRTRLDGFENLGTHDAAVELVDIAKALMQVQALTAGAPCALSCTLDTVGQSETGPAFVGLMPYDSSAQHRHDMNIVDSQLSPIIASASATKRAALREAILLAHARAGARRGVTHATESLTKLLRPRTLQA